MKTLKKIFTVLFATAAVFFFASCETVVYTPIEVPAGTASSYNTSAFAKEMGLGFNLGNYLDATGGSGLNSESSWRGGQKITKEMVTALKDAGVKTVRVPVSWSNHITDKNNYTIDSAWLDRVKEVVDYAISQNMKVIVNIHHDNKSEKALASGTGYAVTSDKDLKSKSANFIQKVWIQIAEKFKDYDENIVFELLNEPRCVGTNREWSGPTSDDLNCVTYYEQVALDAIRNIAGDKKHYVVVPSYAASDSGLSNYSLPDDYVDDRLIFAFHAYAPYSFAMQKNAEGGHSYFSDGDRNSLTAQFNNIDRIIHGKRAGIGIIIGEMGATNKNNLSDREAWFDFYIKEAYGNHGMPCFIWDNGSIDNPNESERYGYLNPKDNTWFFPSLIKAAREATYGPDQN